MSEELSDVKLDSPKQQDSGGSPVSTSSIQAAQLAIDDEHDILIRKYIEACQAGDLVTVKDLIETGAVELGSDVDPGNVSGLHWAAINNRLSIVKYLVSKGADVDKEGGDLNATPLHWACRYGLVYIADYLIKNGADPTKIDSQGFNALHLAVHSSNIMLVIYILVFVEQIPIDATDPSGRTALHWAGYQGDSLSVDSLLKFNANVKLVDSEGFTPLHWSLIRGQHECLKRLIEEGSELYQKTNDGKNCFDIAQDMNSVNSLRSALWECGLDYTGQHITRLFSAEWAKVITFITPYFIIGCTLELVAKTNIIVTVLVAAALMYISTQLLNKFIFPCYVRTHRPFLKSPYLSGVFSGTAFWILLVWIVTVLPNTISEAPFANLVFLGLSVAVIYSFFRAMFKDPGIVSPPDSNKEIKENIESLLKVGQYDAKHFCINTYVKLPLRSKYSSFHKKVVARYDHFCPWVYNDVGLRNHKVFMFFACSLELGMICFLHLVMEFFDEIEDDDYKCSLLDDKLCAGYVSAPFIFFLSAWTLFQCIWVTFLLFSQFFQISKGLTSVELSVYTKRVTASNVNFSSAPAELIGPDASPAAPPRQRTCLSTLCLLTGIDQFIIAAKQVFGLKSDAPIESVPTDYGVKQNCIDFWFASGDDHLKINNLFKLPVSGEANLNGETVNYYELYALPEKRITYDHVV